MKLASVCVLAIMAALTRKRGLMGLKHEIKAILNRTFAGGVAVAVCVAIGLGLVAESLIKWVGDWCGDHAALIYLVAGLALLSVGVLFLLRGPVRQWLRRPWERPDLVRLQGLASLPAVVLVVTASRGPGVRSAKTAIDHHRASCRHVYVLHTDDEAGRGALGEVNDHVKSMSTVTVHPCPLDANAIQDPAVVFARLAAIGADVEERGSTERREVVFDYTGGTKAFTAAMTLFASANGWRLQYVVPDHADADGRAVADSSGRVIEVELLFGSRGT